LARGPLERDASVLSRTVTDERERVYAAAAVWAGQRMAPGSLVAASEIGAIGFFLPHDLSVLDLFGLLRNNGTPKATPAELIERNMPVCVLTRFELAEKTTFVERLRGKYVWFDFRTLGIGVRNDVAAGIDLGVDNLQTVYEKMSLDREHPWPEGRGGRSVRQ
jgi:hypothetical protein